ncbi:uncharacterized protein LOC121876042 [Homarus americanus]|uniref:uncharacterized protein LOC121876042 n=1 Tax=Homarus americanus TaxID=6706 RepID=UPI001C49251C|nr:uncharacterized protein LOC121876042 [Homarus americanus]
MEDQLKTFGMVYTSTASIGTNSNNNFTTNPNGERKDVPVSFSSSSSSLEVSTITSSSVTAASTSSKDTAPSSTSVLKSTTTQGLSNAFNQSYTTEVRWEVHKAKHYSSLDTSLEDFEETFDNDEEDADPEGSEYERDDGAYDNDSVSESDNTSGETESTLRASSATDMEEGVRGHCADIREIDGIKVESKLSLSGNYYKERYTIDYDQSGWRGVELFIREKKEDLDASTHSETRWTSTDVRKVNENSTVNESATDNGETDFYETDNGEKDFNETDIGETDFDGSDAGDTETNETESERTETDSISVTTSTEPSKDEEVVEEKPQVKQDRQGNLNKSFHGELELERPSKQQPRPRWQQSTAELELESPDRGEKSQKSGRRLWSRSNSGEKEVTAPLRRLPKTPSLQESTASELDAKSLTDKSTSHAREVTFPERDLTSAMREMSVMRSRLTNLRKIIHDKNEEIRELKARMKVEKTNSRTRELMLQREKQTKQGVELVSSIELAHLRRELTVLRQEKDRLRAELTLKAAAEREKAAELRKCKQEHERQLKVVKMEVKRDEVRENHQLSLLHKSISNKEKTAAFQHSHTRLSRNLVSGSGTWS